MTTTCPVAAVDAVTASQRGCAPKAYPSGEGCAVHGPNPTEQAEVGLIKVVTTITTIIDPSKANADMMTFHIDVASDRSDVPPFLINGAAQASCEAAMIQLHEKGIGVLGYSLEDLDRDPDTLPVDNSRCPQGNMYRLHMNGPCSEGCDLVEVVV